MANLDSADPQGKSKQGFFASVGALVLSRGSIVGAQLLVLPVLARHLTVAEFALMALAMTVVIFSSVLSDAGLGRSLIRTRDYDPAEWSTVFWLLVGTGVVLCLGILVIAPFWAWFFEEPSLWPLMSALALVPLLQSISAPHNANIERREGYASLARLQTFAAMAGLVVAVGLAFLGAGVWALVAQQLVLGVVRFAGLVYLSDFHPRMIFIRAMLKGHLRFARDSVSTSIISVAQKQGVTMIVGKLLGAQQLGIFAMSERFTRLPQFGLAGPASSVVYVRMSKVQDDPEKLVGIYLASMRLLAAVLLPGIAIVAIAGSEFFTVILSEKWAAVAPVFALSIPGLGIEAVSVTCLACLFRATGHTPLQVRLVIEGTALLLPLAFFASLIGINAVAATFSIWALLYVPRAWMLARRIVPLSYRDCLAALARPVAVSVAMAAIYHAVWRHQSPDPLVQIAGALVLMGLAYGVVAVWDWPRLQKAVTFFS